VICLEAERLLQRYVDNELEPAEETALQAHLPSCAACRSFLADLDALGRLVRRLPYFPAPDHLRANIVRRTNTRQRFNRTLLAWAAAVALAVSLGGSVEVMRFARERRVVEATVAVAGIPIGTVMSRLARARERLLAILGPTVTVMGEPS